VFILCLFISYLSSTILVIKVFFIEDTTMQILRKSEERGTFRNDWLDAHHSFSFGEYHDRNHMGVANLRVLNDDIIAPKGGFPTHPHQDMEIITYVLSGALQHRDSMGNGSVIRAGDVQRMSAGSGIEHSEFNPSSDEPVNLLQIWLHQNRLGVEPEYDQRHYDDAEKRGDWLLLVSPDGQDGSIRTWQDGLLFATLLEEDERADYSLTDDRIAYLHVAKGNVIVNGTELECGDAVTISDEAIKVTTGNNGEVLLFDLPRNYSQ
jgi:redox-sensitive bicupin YhaK (pirin superfamily)